MGRMEERLKKAIAKTAQDAKKKVLSENALRIFNEVA